MKLNPPAIEQYILKKGKFSRWELASVTAVPAAGEDFDFEALAEAAESGGRAASIVFEEAAGWNSAVSEKGNNSVFREC